MSEQVDVAIIGAGPAGSTLAAILARRGLAVALIDRDVFPRDKLCGEFLSYDALPVLDALGVLGDIDAAGSPRITRCRVAGNRGSYEFTFPHPARGVSRLFLDDLLLRKAVSHGARRLDGWTASDIGNDGEMATVTIARGEETRTITARALAGAWGRWGRFDSLLGRGFVRDRTHRNFGFKRHYRAASSHDSEVIELHSFRRGYLGVSAVEGNVTNICGLVHASRLTGHKGRWESFIDEIRAEERHLGALFASHEPAQEGFLSSEPVIFRARSPVEQGIFMIGDASGVIDPLTGNGMAMAIQSALLAAPRLAELVANPAERPRLEREYTVAHAAMFTSRIGWSRRIARLLSRPRLLDALLATRSPRWLGSFLLQKTRAPYEAIARLAEHMDCGGSPPLSTGTRPNH
ncbi:MAG TPA: NAD(P)/FAD-dependent oxidoreductase [Thermoanaerobaculia bacterium]|nr:NAD(P)/FAD-dependent oxidoreductase [Thermoanaerobaculia bacterium]